MLSGNALQSLILDLQGPPPILELITMAIIKECKQGRCTGACARGQRLGGIDPSIDVCPGFPPRPSHPDHLDNSVPESQLEMRPMWNHKLTECGRCIKGWGRPSNFCGERDPKNISKSDWLSQIWWLIAWHCLAINTDALFVIGRLDLMAPSLVGKLDICSG